MCKHETFQVDAKVARLTKEEGGDVTGYSMDIEVCCKDCHMPFRFIGLPGGYSPSYPTVDFEQIQARMPIAPI